MKQNEKLKLPIDSHISEILEAVRSQSTIIVKASPGSGKTTRLPWAIAENSSGKVVVLEPRRLAAKLAAARIAEESGLSLGKEVGYHFRFEKNVTPDTKLIFYTEGTFLKQFLSNPDLKEVEVVILDEFHERHLDTDLAFALLRDLQKKRNLKVILMSATLDIELLKTIQDSRAIEVEGITYPVEVSYLPNQPSVLNENLELKVRRAVEKTEGDTLVFLPGMREMLRAQDSLTGNYDVYLLHAELTKEEQARALKPSSRRKIILSTNIAESSVTIPGIRTVIDSGIQREARYSPWNGLKFIQDTKVTKSSAIQRAGRAGRTGPGVCHRLYSEQDYNEREEHTVPELERADLTDVCLLVSGTSLSPIWFHEPNPEKWKKSLSLLENLGALKEGKLTSTGLKMLEYPLDSRLGRILIEGEKLVLKKKEQLLRYIAEVIEQDRTGTLKRRLGFYLKSEGKDDGPWEKCLLTGFVDQVAKFRSKQRDFIHYSGKILKAHSSLTHLEDGLYIVLDITQKQEAVQVMEVQEEWLWDLDPFPFHDEDEIEVRPRLSSKRKTKIGSIVIEESQVKLSWKDLKPEMRAKVLKETASLKEKAIIEWKHSPRGEKILYYLKYQHQMVDIQIDLGIYLEHNDDWENLPYFVNEQIESQLNLGDIDQLLPSKLNLGGRRDLTIHYEDGAEPYLEAPIQDFYGINESPAIMNGKVPLTLKLLGPHKRPIQITKDLKSFWQKTYQEMKKEYQRDYPRHYWPDKPWEAKPYLLKSHIPKA